MRVKSLLKITTISLITLFVCGYGLFEARNLLTGPVITVLTPQNGSKQITPLVEVAGVVKNVSDISLNDRPITMDMSGNFSEKVLLAPGYNILKLTVADKFGRKKEEC